MKGAREFAKLFKTGQYGRLFLISGSHARGETFHIYVLPKGIKVESRVDLSTTKNTIEVYGIVDGQPGWTERYDWIHQGKWCTDFGKLVIKRKKEIENLICGKADAEKKKEILEKKRILKLLDIY